MILAATIPNVGQRYAFAQPTNQVSGQALARLYDMNRLKEAMLLLIEDTVPLPPEWLDHALAGNWTNHRECHVGGDFLLIYKLDSSGAEERVIFVRAGTHAELFG